MSSIYSSGESLVRSVLRAVFRYVKYNVHIVQVLHINSNRHRKSKPGVSACVQQGIMTFFFLKHTFLHRRSTAVLHVKLLLDYNL